MIHIKFNPAVHYHSVAILAWAALPEFTLAEATLTEAAHSRTFIA